MAGDDPGDHVSEVGVRLDAVELACLDQRSDRCPMLGAAVGAGEERILAVQRNWADGALDDVGVDLDRAVVEESCQTLPARERVADSFRQLGLLVDKVSCCLSHGSRALMTGRLLSCRTARRSSA